MSRDDGISLPLQSLESLWGLGGGGRGGGSRGTTACRTIRMLPRVPRVPSPESPYPTQLCNIVAYSCRRSILCLLPRGTHQDKSERGRDGRSRFTSLLSGRHPMPLWMLIAFLSCNCDNKNSRTQLSISVTFRNSSKRLLSLRQFSFYSGAQSRHVTTLNKVSLG